MNQNTNNSEYLNSQITITIAITIHNRNYNLQFIIAITITIHNRNYNSQSQL